jgi:hypothetical protein
MKAHRTAASVSGGIALFAAIEVVVVIRRPNLFLAIGDVNSLEHANEISNSN